MASVTINTTDGQHVFGGTVVDPANNAITGETGDVFAWTTDDTTLLQVFASSQRSCRDRNAELVILSS